MTVEICANSRHSAENALAGGAHRIELCSRLEVGGITPSSEDIAYCVNTLQLRTHVLVRPRAGDFCYSRSEFDTICHNIDMCRSLGASAIVVGFLTPDGQIDEPRLRKAVALATPMEVTFHRAFDEMLQPMPEALETVIDSGCTRLLTSGGCASAEEGIEMIRKLQKQSHGRISIMAGAGITPANAVCIALATGVSELHGSCKRSLADGTIETDPALVRQLVENIDNLDSNIR